MKGRNGEVPQEETETPLQSLSSPFGSTTPFVPRPLPPCVAGESDSTGFAKYSDLVILWNSSASESDSPAGRAGRGLSNLNGVDSSHGTFLTCHARSQGPLRTVPCAPSVCFCSFAEIACWPIQPSATLRMASFSADDLEVCDADSDSNSTDSRQQISCPGG